jgi:hypothetical protein
LLSDICGECKPGIGPTARKKGRWRKCLCSSCSGCVWCPPCRTEVGVGHNEGETVSCRCAEFHVEHAKHKPTSKWVIGRSLSSRPPRNIPSPPSTFRATAQPAATSRFHCPLRANASFISRHFLCLPSSSFIPLCFFVPPLFEDSRAQAQRRAPRPSTGRVQHRTPRGVCGARVGLR